MEKRDTIGRISAELLEKEILNPSQHTVVEQMQEQLCDYDKNIYECVEAAKKTKTDDFYIVVLTKKERLMQNVIRNYFFSRNSCPTPDYDQAVYKYKKDIDAIDFLWVIPSKDTCELLRDNALQVHESERELLNFVLSFYDNSLLKLCKTLNGETEYTGQLILGEQ